MNSFRSHELCVPVVSHSYRLGSQTLLFSPFSLLFSSRRRPRPRHTYNDNNKFEKRGRGCADDYPIVYTRISYFYDWIVETMCVLNATGVPDYVNCDDIVIDVDIDDDDNFNFNIDYNESLSGSSSIDNDINNGTIVTETVVVAVVDDNNNATSLSSSWDSIDDNANANDDDEEYITLIEIFTAENNNNNKKTTTTTMRDEKDRRRQIGNTFDDTTRVP